ncbi:MAG: PhnA protein, partial [Crocinitomicaceae bacterium]
MKQLTTRSNGQCEICGSNENLTSFAVPPRNGDSLEDLIQTCKNCHDQLTGEAEIEPNHWRCLNDAMWSEVSAVKVVAYRM